MRMFIHCLAVFLFSIVVVVSYGTWPRTKPLMTVPAESAPYEIGSDVFANNFDYLEDYLNEELDRALDAIRVVENRKGDPEAVGDQHLRHKAYGLYQIRQPYLDDVNRLVGTNGVEAVWGKPYLTIEDMKDGKKARWVARKYLEHYGRRYERRTGKEVTAGVYSRMHNGGPDGWTKESTNSYLGQIMEELK